MAKKDATSLSAREIIAREYGSSRNLLTPNRLAIGKLGRDRAYELSAGEGIEYGSKLFGVSVVRVVAGGTERDYDQSAAFSSLEAANEWIESLRDEHAWTCSQAEKLGYDAGKAAGSWIIDGNSTDEQARTLLDGIEDGDPAVLDLLPSAPFSGEWADGLDVRDVLDSYGYSLDDDGADEILSAFEDGYSRGVVDEAVRSARALLGVEVPA